jgi:NADPH:quinone reductase
MMRRPPFVMGYDVVGEIDQIGVGVGGFQVGDRVADLTVVGSNAAYCTLRADHLARVPAGVDAAEAAALILSWTTAFQLLHRLARVQRGQRVLVQGAAGAVGQALLALGRLAGLELWGTARGAHAPLVRELGAHPIDYQHEDFTCPAGRVRRGVRRRRRGRLSAFLRRAEAGRRAMRLWLFGECPG